MARGDVRDRQSGHEYDDLTPARTYSGRREYEAEQAQLNDEERKAFNAIADQEEQQELKAHTYANRAEAEAAGVYTPQNNPYDDNGLYHDRSGFTRRDSSDHAGYTRRESDGGRYADDNAGFTRRDLRNAEEGGGGGKGIAGLAGGKSGGDSGPLSNLGDKENTPFSYSNNGAKWSSARGFIQKHKKKLIAGGLAGIGIFPLLALLLFILGALKIPHFVENVAAWRFASVNRVYRSAMNNVIGEKNAFDSLSDSDKEKVKAKYGKYEAFDKVNRLRPNRVLQSLKASDRIQYNYKKTLLGRQKLTSITFAPGDDLKSRVTVEVPTGRFDRVLHPIQTIDKYKAISDALNSAMRAHDPKISVVTRSLVTKQVLQKAGASLKGMAAERYLGKNTQAQELNKIYASIVENAKKYNQELQKYTALVDEYDAIYKQRADAYKVYHPIAEKYYKAAATVGGYALFSAGTDPSTITDDMLQQARAAMDEVAAIQDEFHNQRAIITDFDNKVSDLRSQMSASRVSLQNLDSERLSLSDRFSAAGGELSDRDAKIAIQQEAYEKAHRNGGIATITDDKLRKVAEDADQATEDTMNDREQVGQMVDKGQDIPDAASAAVERGLTTQNAMRVLEKVVSATNVSYDIVAVACMMEDGSKIKAGSVDATHDSKVSEAAYVLSTKDQIADGVNTNTAAVNAMNWKLGNIRESNAIRRQEGRPVNTLDTVSSQRSTMGNYSIGTTIFDVMGIGFLNDYADTWCPKLTNVWVGLGIGLGLTTLTIITSIFSGGGTAAVSVGAKKAAEEVVEKTVSKVMASALKKGIKNFAKAGRFGKEFTKEAAKGTAKFATIAASATFMAKWIVLSKTGGLSNGVEKDVSFDDNVDEGTLLLSGDMNRANFYGRPLNNVETVQSHKADRAEQAYYNSHLSPFERYLALENPNSMAARMATTVGVLADKSIFASMLNGMANLFNPIGLSSKLFANVNGSAALAQSNQNTEDYGDVVWGYSYQELQLMKQPSYASPSENEYQLDQSGKEDEIQSKYDKCYSDTIGNLLEHQDITRDEDGNVRDDGDCSPEELGPENPTYGDLVFRWRLKHNYANTSDNLLGIQDPSSVQDQQLGNLGNIPSGTAQELAKKILDNTNISFQTPAERDAMEYIASTGHARTCGNTATSPQLLGVLLSAASKYKIVIGVLTDGHGCNSDPQTHAHAKGLAADINGVNPLNGGGGGTGNMIDAGEFNSNALLKQFYGDLGDILAQSGGGEIGQIECFGSAPQKNSKIHYFNDVCNHVHVDVVH